MNPGDPSTQMKETLKKEGVSIINHSGKLTRNVVSSSDVQQELSKSHKKMVAVEEAMLSSQELMNKMDKILQTANGRMDRIGEGADGIPQVLNEYNQGVKREMDDSALHMRQGDSRIAASFC
mmetsp:Transcript_22892/g.35614  ORF Transcript_22892/g.35614 Transcript_22892/m.35614 type:complete len:122 (-) Transcript_22892:92-457(-)